MWPGLELAAIDGRPKGNSSAESLGMEFRALEITGPAEVLPRRFADDRGYFSEVFKLNEFERQIGPVDFVQVNESLSVRPGTVRGIHFQTAPRPQGKLVRCVSGAIFDVAVDLRRDSPSFGRWVSATLTGTEGNQLWIPAGFGHGFTTLEANSIVSYRVTDYYSPEHDKGVAWDDPDIGIVWPDIADPETLSPKDRRQPALADLPAYFSMKDSQCA
jgi:dTDP-4-dehydrorhamnose 3,5-epimerase